MSHIAYLKKISISHNHPVLHAAKLKKRWQRGTSGHATTSIIALTEGKHMDIRYELNKQTHSSTHTLQV